MRNDLRIAPANLAVIALAGLAGTAHGAPDDDRPPAWANDFTARLEALAVLQTLNADLLGHDSATLTLDRWCATHKLAPAGSKIVAQRVRDQDKPADAHIRELLAVKPDEPIAYRRVRLACGDRILSEADNWYVPARLTPDMNNTLDTTNTPFGKVVQPLHFQRHTLSSTLLWLPLPDGWEMSDVGKTGGAGSMSIPPAVLENKAVLSLPDGTPFSEVVETYSSNVLAFSPPDANR